MKKPIVGVQISRYNSPPETEAPLPSLTMSFTERDAGVALLIEAHELEDGKAVLDLLNVGVMAVREVGSVRECWTVVDRTSGAEYPQPNRMIAEKVAEMHGNCGVLPPSAFTPPDPAAASFGPTHMPFNPQPR